MGGSREGVRVLKIQIRSKITENKHAPPGKHIHIYSVLLFILKLTPPPLPWKKNSGFAIFCYCYCIIRNK